MLKNKRGYFRGKDCKTNEWRYGYLYEDNGASLLVLHDGMFLTWYDANECYVTHVDMNLVESDSVSIMTGYNDTNNIPVFEKDILSRFIDGREERGFIDYSHGSFNVIFFDRSEMLLDSFCDVDQYYVIGNLLDNPEYFFNQE